jgi:AcrR family transcriptional regulator
MTRSTRNVARVAAQKPRSRLSVEDWLQAGYTLLAEQGARALKVDRLCQQAGVTRGSFYWHFEDMDSYRATLVESWNTFLERDRHDLAELDALPPRKRLSAMMTTLISPRQCSRGRPTPDSLRDKGLRRVRFQSR